MGKELDSIAGVRLEAQGGQNFSKTMENAAGSLEKFEDAAKTAQTATGGLADALAQAQRDRDTQAKWDEFADSSTELAAVIALQAQGAARLVSAFFDATEEAAAFGDAIDKGSQKLGISRRAYQEWSYILGQSGGSINNLKTATQQLAKVQEGLIETAGKDLEAVGLSLEGIQNLSREELFEKVITGLQGMGESSKRAMLAQRLLGSSYKELTPLLNTSAEDTARLRDRFYELDAYISDEAVNAAVAYGDSVGDLNTKWDSFRRNLLIETMPALTRVREALLNDKSLDSIAGMVERLANGGVSLLEYLADHGDAAVGTIKTIGGAWATWKAGEIVGTILTNVKQLYGWLGALAGALGVSMGTLAGGAALAGVTVAGVAKEFSDITTGGKLGANQELEEYRANAERLKATLDELVEQRENLPWYAPQGTLESLNRQINVARAQYENAKNELAAMEAAAQETAAQAPQELSSAAQQAAESAQDATAAGDNLREHRRNPQRLGGRTRRHGGGCGRRDHRRERRHGA